MGGKITNMGVLEKEILLQRISRYLIINSSSIENIGLYHGKMGIVLFFALYGRYINNKLFIEFAETLLDEIYEEINSETTIYFESGLSGIAWGIEYLVQKQLMFGDTDEILEDINNQIIDKLPRNINDYSLKKGVTGIEYYFFIHLSSKTKERSLSYQFLQNKLEFLNVENNSKMFDEDIDSFLNKIFINTEILENKDLSDSSLGLEFGLAGLGIKLMRS